MPANPLNTDDFGGELYNLGMSEGARPLLDKVKAFIADEVEPITAEFFRLGEDRQDRWSFAPGQLELLDGVKAKAKASGLWNFFLPDAETGQGLSNLDYAYIAVELGKNPLASECLNCSAPDTGNMEVLERVGTPEQKKQWLEPLLNGEIRSCFAMTEPDMASLRRPQHRHRRRARRRRVGHQRREVLHLRRRRPALQDHDLHGPHQPGCGRPPPAVADPRADGHPRRRDARARCTSSATTTPPTVTCTSASPTCGCRRTTCCSARGGASRSPSSASARVASTTACARSARPSGPSS